MNPDGATAYFNTIDHKVVSISIYFTGFRFQFVFMLFFW